MPAKADHLDKSDYELLAAWRYALRRFLHFSEQAAEKAGLAPQQHQALLAIKGFPGRDYASIGEIAERLRLRHHSVVGLIDRLEERKLVRRVASKIDQRRVDVRLTVRGDKMLGQLATAHLREIQDQGPEVRRLLDLLTKL